MGLGKRSALRSMSPTPTRFVLPLSICSFWTEGEAQAGLGAGVDERFAPDSIINFPVAESKPEPVVNEIQRLRGVSLKGLFTFIVSPSGRVVDVFALSSNSEEFRDSCLEAISSWRFSPMTLNGRGIYCRMQVPILWNA